MKSLLSFLFQPQRQDREFWLRCRRLLLGRRNYPDRDRTSETTIEVEASFHADPVLPDHVLHAPGHADPFLPGYVFYLDLHIPGHLIQGDPSIPSHVRVDLDGQPSPLHDQVLLGADLPWYCCVAVDIPRNMWTLQIKQFGEISCCFKRYGGVGLLQRYVMTAHVFNE